MSKSTLNHPNINRLIEQHGTPLQIIDLETLRANIVYFRGHFPKFELYYSTKTNPDPAVLEIMHQEGLSFDAASIGEITTLINRGVAPNTILFTHPIKSVIEVQDAQLLGVRKYVLDSLQELKKLAEHAPDAAYYLRVRPIGNEGLYDYENKHGADETEAREILEHAAANKLNVAGLSFHVGSQTMSPKPWQDVIEYCYSLVTNYHDSIKTLRSINIGSGFPGTYSFDSGTVPSLGIIADAITQSLSKFPDDMQFMAEPGRPLVATASKIITSVVDRVDRSDGNWLFTDMSAYHGLIEIIESAGKLTYPISSLDDDAETLPFTVAGKTLDPDDIFGRNMSLQSDCKADDKLVLHDVGAYSTSFYTSYHSIPSPTMAYIDSVSDPAVLVGVSEVATHGVIAQRNFDPHEKIFTVSGYRSPSRTRTSFQISETGHLEPCLMGAYLNHSCDPNAGIRTNELGLLDVVALQPIATGEEVIVDYAMFEYELADMATVACNCGTLLCRRHINGYKGLDASMREKYEGFVATHLVGKV